MCSRQTAPSDTSPGSQTFANYAQAVETFWEDTVLPLFDDTLAPLNYWLAPAFGDEALRLTADKDSISALQAVRQAKYALLKNADFLTPNQKRVEAGFDEYDSATTNPADMLYIPSGMMPIDMAGADMSDYDKTGTDPNTDPEDTHAGGAQG